jgi:GGDEF domain-containing protein
LGRVGHLGGDDFVVIFQSDDWKLECEQILKVLKSNFITISMIKIYLLKAFTVSINVLKLSSSR